MMDDRAFESLLQDALARPGEPAPFTVDVADRVMRRVAVADPPRRVERRQLARWAAAAAVVGVLLLAAASRTGPSVEAIVAALGLTTAELANVAAKLAAPASAVASAFSRVIGALAGTIQAVVGPLAAFESLVRVVLVALTAGMLGVTTFIVGRDVRRPAADQEPA